MSASENTNVERIAPLVDTTNVEEGLGLEDKDGGKTLVRFEVLPELEPANS